MKIGKENIRYSRRKEKSVAVRGRIWKGMTGKSSGIDGLLVSVGLCIIALLLCVVMKDKLEIFIGTVVDSLTQKAIQILG